MKWSAEEGEGREGGHTVVGLTAVTLQSSSQNLQPLGNHATAVTTGGGGGGDVIGQELERASALV